MSGYKATLIDCKQCHRRILVRGVDAERGQIVCSHPGCGALNTLPKAYRYDEALVQGLPGFGTLTYLGDGARSYQLRFGSNRIGTADTADVVLDRYQHKGRCYISRQHCTLTVTFDSWAGALRYQLQDGAIDPTTQTLKSSLNGTRLDEHPLLKTECIDVPDGAVITLGGIDRFRLTHYPLNPVMLATYRIELGFNPDRTE